MVGLAELHQGGLVGVLYLGSLEVELHALVSLSLVLTDQFVQMVLFRTANPFLFFPFHRTHHLLLLDSDLVEHLGHMALLFLVLSLLLLLLLLEQQVQSVLVRENVTELLGEVFLQRVAFTVQFLDDALVLLHQVVQLSLVQLAFLEDALLKHQEFLVLGRLFTRPVVTGGTKASVAGGGVAGGVVPGSTRGGQLQGLLIPLQTQLSHSVMNKYYIVHSGVTS